MTAEVWALADPRAGTAAQALGIAERLGPHRVIPLEWGMGGRLPWPFPTLMGLTPAARAPFAAPWPRLVVSAGRRAGPVARWLGARGARTVHCMRAFGRFDLSVIGRHDAPGEAPDVLPILGAAHRVTAEKLAAARAEWAALSALPAPRVALLLGGPVRGQGLAPGLAAALGAQVAGFAGSVLASASRRTGAEATEALAQALSPVPHRLHRWGDTATNPYLGFLAWADAVVVSGDSVSMLSEALMTAAPLFVAPLGGEGRRHLALHESLYAAGQARPLTEAPAPFARAPLDEVGRVAAEIRARGWL
ncbi:mitochondrial fission ELM1 family protein [Falsiroseomonas tokyonensis]|uniref:Mitochondrial fission ELM1 family protein n=1 Tax=Falsiroseomonas tokyonensis TaxID=430521 RepID=A0ABV7BRP7_9PROT|nr:ELM1/GtrOC1 family putative glycosyltransferase [Falsiroseomonas tokyonensis]MBU8537883.1 mitochondrial fission ELM1 family protein [Falsiroseomonas tokyonensis]